MTHKVIATGDGQGERGMAAPQMVGACFVGEKNRDDISGILQNRAFIYTHCIITWNKAYIIEVKQPGHLHITFVIVLWWLPYV